jgi:DNA primase
MPEPRPLYRLPDLASARLVVVTEGEKTADAARSIGFTATTSAGGSQAAMKTDWQPLAGKEVWIFPDNDRPGRKYADTVAGLCRAAGTSEIRVLDLAEHAAALPEGGA